IVLGLETAIRSPGAERRLQIVKPRPNRTEWSATLRQAVAKHAALVDIASDAVFEDTAVHRPLNLIPPGREFQVPWLTAGDSLRDPARARWGSQPKFCRCWRRGCGWRRFLHDRLLGWRTSGEHGSKHTHPDYPHGSLRPL